MSRVDDKARFYLERTVPQLREFEAKNIFSKDEIRTLVQKRTDFERLVLSPGCKASDFLAYIAWEQSLESLRRKRCQRLKVQQSTSFASEARTFQMFERGVLKHPGSAVLWHDYLAFAERVRATKRWRRVMTRALRMLPGDATLWVAAAQKEIQNGNMEGARSIFLRGCRFCTADGLVWVEYARAEMDWLARLSRRGKQGLSAQLLAEATSDALDGGNDADGHMLLGESGDENSEDEDDFSNTIALPKSMTDAGADKKAAAAASQELAQQLEKSAALAGALPQAIFDIAKKQPFFGPETAETFFDMFASFARTPVRTGLLEHVLAVLAEQYPAAAATWSCRVRQPMLDLGPDDAAFPGALRAALAKLREGMQASAERQRLAGKSLAWIRALLARESLDSGIRIVLEDARRRLERE